jgi:PAS domain S-box-containing protein
MQRSVILAVDDSAESLQAVTEILTSNGYDVRPADSGELALASLAAAKPDLILLDIRMPLMDGFEVCRRIKAGKETRDIPVIFLSVLTDTGDCVEGLKLGAVDFVSKPFEKQELLVRIQNHLELSRLRNQLEQIVAERTADLKSANRRLKRELTERIRAEHALRESEERFRSMADHAPVMVWTSGPDAKINFVNNYILNLTGRTAGELVGEGWKTAVHPEDLEQKYPEYAGTIAAGREYRVEYRVRRSDGEYRWMLDTATPRRLPDGSFAGYVGIAVDITDLKRQHEHFAASQKMESLGVLVAGVAHNFNNLMGAIIAEADLALSELSAASPAHGNVERINAIAIRAADIVHLLTAYASAGSTGALTAVDVSQITEETLQLVKATVSRNTTFCVSIAKVPPIHADTAQIRQVVINLMTNACESLPNQEGTVWVNTSVIRVDASNHIRSELLLPEGEYVRLGVADTGRGIPSEIRTQIFDPFFTTKSLGRGLGLAAVQGIVRSLGGGIRFESVPGKGSTFEVLLPCITAAQVVADARQGVGYDSYPAGSTC